MTLSAGIAMWGAELMLVACLSASPAGARVGFLVSALFLPLPAFVNASPLGRCLLACFVGATFVCAAEYRRIPAGARFHTRLALLGAYFDPRQVSRRARRFDAGAFAKLVVFTSAFAAAVATVKAAPNEGLGGPIRLLAGGVGLLAVAGMAAACHDLATKAAGVSVPGLFRAPFGATSVGSFWARHWNLPASAAFRTYCFTPLRRRGPALALFATFVASAVGHALIARLALREWWPALSCAAFFLAQPLLIAVERLLAVRRWPTAAGRGWTMAALAATSPLVVEPVLRMAEKVWGEPTEMLRPTAAVLGFCAGLGLLAAVVSLTCSRPGTISRP
jgi:hypothetical protein